jgi:hypothetical protein
VIGMYLRHRAMDWPGMFLAIFGMPILWTTEGFCAEPREHGGFFFRLSVGPAYARTERDPAPGVVFGPDLSGPSADYNVAIGGTVAPNLALHATFFGWTDLPAPEMNNSDLTATAAGGGLTAYIMPANVYVSASVGIAKLAGFEDSDAGIMGDFTLGKEWWVGNHWGVGLAAGWSPHSIPSGEVNENWRGQSFAFRFSATRN